MKSIKLFAVLLVGAFLLLGCTQVSEQPPVGTSPGAAPESAPITPQSPSVPSTIVPEPVVEPEPQQTAPEPEPQQTEPTNVAMDQIYQYGSISSYTYRLTSSGAPSMDMTTTISSDTIDGTSAWLQKTDMSTEGMSIVSSTWLDKATSKCLKMSSSMDVGGQIMETETPCPQTSPNSASGTGTETPELEYVGTESITVPAGTFDANKYALGGTTFWIASSVPLPLKTSSDGGKVVMELVEYN